MTNRIAAERLTDRARVVFEGAYLREHVHLGYAVTVHSAQGVTADTAHAVIGETASRALVYVAMSRGRHANHAYIYTREPGETDPHHRHVPDDGQAHQLRRGTKYSAAHYFRMILGNDDRPRTMHAEAERTAGQERQPIVAALLERNEQRRRARHNTWRRHTAAERAWHAAYERITDTAEHSAERSRSHDQSYGLEL